MVTHYHSRISAYTTLILASALLGPLSGCSSEDGLAQRLDNLDHPLNRDATIEIAGAFCTYMADCFHQNYESCFTLAVPQDDFTTRSPCSSQEVKACSQAIDLMGCTDRVQVPGVCRYGERRCFHYTGRF